MVTETTRALGDALGMLDRSLYTGVPAQAWDLVARRTTTALTSLAASDPSRAPTTASDSDATTASAPSRRRGPRRPR